MPVKTPVYILMLLLLLPGCKSTNMTPEKPAEKAASYDTADLTNNFYDNTQSYPLSVPEITVDGEIANPGKVELSSLPVRSIFVKETVLDSAGGDKFVGAYKYDGFSLFDILDKAKLQKANAKEFNPIIDLYVEVTNDQGDRAVFSWGEIYYPNNLHRILIANRVSRIVPSKTKDLWPLPKTSKIVAGTDLITERNISNPVKITVKSYPKSFTVNQGMSPMYSKEFAVFDGDKKLALLSPAFKDQITYNTVFYGRGRGIHSTSPFGGVMLKDMIQKFFPVSGKNLKSGLFCLTALDGYRCTLSYSELFNRNDQQEFLLVRTKPNEDGGLFKIFAAGDFFSDRAIKSLTGIYFLN
jgi:hypothetical protein